MVPDAAAAGGVDEIETTRTCTCTREPDREGGEVLQLTTTNNSGASGQDPGDVTALKHPFFFALHGGRLVCRVSDVSRVLVPLPDLDNYGLGKVGLG